VPDLVRVKINGFEKNVGADFAKSNELDLLKDEPTHRPDGQPRGMTRTGGRRVKPRTSVAKKAAEKKKATSKAETAEEASK
jgi:hypothetical protein